MKIVQCSIYSKVQNNVFERVSPLVCYSVSESVGRKVHDRVDSVVDITIFNKADREIHWKDFGEVAVSP